MNQGGRESEEDEWWRAADRREEVEDDMEERVQREQAQWQLAVQRWEEETVSQAAKGEMSGMVVEHQNETPGPQLVARMTGEEQQRLWGIMEERLVKVGSLEQDTIYTRMTQYMMKKVGRSWTAGDVVWSWVADKQAEGDVRVDQAMRRRSRGVHSPVIRQWQWKARMAAGQAEHGMTVQALGLLHQLDKILKHLVEAEVGLTMEEWDDMREGMPLNITVQGVRAAWSKVKDGYGYKGGYQQYLSHIGVLMLQGETEGTVGERALGMEWWRRACSMAHQTLGMPVGVTMHQLDEEARGSGSDTEEWEWEERDGSGEEEMQAIQEVMGCQWEETGSCNQEGTTRGGLEAESGDGGREQSQSADGNDARGGLEADTTATEGTMGTGRRGGEMGPLPTWYRNPGVLEGCLAQSRGEAGWWGPCTTSEGQRSRAKQGQARWLRQLEEIYEGETQCMIRQLRTRLERESEETGAITGHESQGSRSTEEGMSAQRSEGGGTRRRRPGWRWKRIRTGRQKSTGGANVECKESKCGLGGGGGRRRAGAGTGGMGSRR